MVTGQHTGMGRTEAPGQHATGWTWGSLAPFAGLAVAKRADRGGCSPSSPARAAEISMTL